ncbi:MAG: hypothetical protein R3Y10_02655 [Ferrimonas sp.]
MTHPLLLILWFTLASILSHNVWGASKEAANTLPVQLLLTLPDQFNSPVSATLDSVQNLYFSSPNFHNSELLARGQIHRPPLPAIGLVDGNNQLTTWYQYQVADLHPITKQAAPVGLGLGIDGNMYVTDVQMWFVGGRERSRLLRIQVADGQPKYTEVLIEGLNFPSAIAWRGNELYLADAALKVGKDTHYSGVYRFNIDQLSAEKPIKIQPFYGPDKHDPHLFASYESSGRLGMGATGITFDSEGNLYIAIMEEGTILKTQVNDQGEKGATQVLVDTLIAPFNLNYNPRRNQIFLADMFHNAAYSLGLDGTLTLLAQNRDEDGKEGALDGPSAVIVRGDQAVVLNFDALFNSIYMANQRTGYSFTLSQITLPAPPFAPTLSDDPQP